MHVAAFAALAVRPSLDLFSERRFGLGPFTLEPAVVFGAVMLVIGCVLGIRRARDGQRAWPDTPLRRAHVWLAAAYGIMAISGSRLYAGVGVAEGVRELSRVASIVAAFFVVYWWLLGKPSNSRLAWVYLAAGAIPPIVVALWQLATGTGFLEPDGTLRLQGTFSHPNSFAQYLVPFILVLVAGQAGRTWRIGLAVALTVLVALTYSRTAILALATAMASLLALESRLGVKGVLRLVIALAAVGGIVWWLTGGIIVQRFAGIAFGASSWQDALAGESENSYQWRLINWSGLILLGLNHPWLGHGAGMTTHLNPLINSENGVPFNAHNDYVRFFFEGGIMGLACYGVYQALLCLWVIRRARGIPRERSGTAIALGASLLGMTFLTGGTTELSLHTANQYSLYGVLALVSAGAVPAPFERPREVVRANRGDSSERTGPC